MLHHQVTISCQQSSLLQRARGPAHPGLAAQTTHAAARNPAQVAVQRCGILRSAVQDQGMTPPCQQPEVLFPSLSYDEGVVEECTIDNWRSSLKCDVQEASASTRIVVALGKFNALHRGHQSLAVQAANMGGHPFLLSFSGMAAVLGQQEKQPLIAPCDRSRVLKSWMHSCRGLCPRQRYIPFREIRHMSPEGFVKVLAKDLRASGVVAGKNYRFGYRAQGDAELLQRLGRQYGLQVSIVDLVALAGDELGSSHQPEQICSSWVQQLLEAGDINSVHSCLGRPYRLVADVIPAQLQGQDSNVLVPSSSYQNMPPAPGQYHVQLQLVPNNGIQADLQEDLGVTAHLLNLHIRPEGLCLPMQLLKGQSNSKGCYVVLDFLQG